jgi:hypothetical protein
MPEQQLLEQLHAVPATVGATIARANVRHDECNKLLERLYAMAAAVGAMNCRHCNRIESLRRLLSASAAVGATTRLHCNRIKSLQRLRRTNCLSGCMPRQPPLQSAVESSRSIVDACFLHVLRFAVAFWLNTFAFDTCATLAHVSVFQLWLFDDAFALEAFAVDASTLLQLRLLQSRLLQLALRRFCTRGFCSRRFCTRGSRDHSSLTATRPTRHLFAL